MLFYLSSGFILGLSAGLAPGPLLTLVVSQTLTYGIKEGIKVALAPLITDSPIILFSFLIGAQFASSPLPLGLVSLAGAGYICYLAWESLRITAKQQVFAPMSAKSIQKGVLANLLNPHPYMFWITVGTPLLLKSWASGPWGALLWLTAFYIMLVGSKIVLSYFIGRSKGRFQENHYIWLNRILGLLLLFFAVVLAKEGMILVKIWMAQS